MADDTRWRIVWVAVMVAAPLAVAGTSMLVDHLRQRAWTRERWLLGRDFALVGLMIALVGCLRWAQQYLGAIREVGSTTSGLEVSALGGPAPALLIIHMVVMMFAGLMLLAVGGLSAPYRRSRGVEQAALPVITIWRILSINAMGLVPLMTAVAFLMW